MKTIILILLLLIVIFSCSTTKQSASIVSCKQKGKNTLVIVIDSTKTKDEYKPVYIKIILKKEKRKK